MKIIPAIGLFLSGFAAGYFAHWWHKQRRRDAPYAEYEVVPRPVSEEWGMISSKCPQFVSVLSKLLLSLRGLTNRTVATAGPADRLVFALGHIAVEDFMQILFLCRHSFGIGGLQILRSMYERTVTMAYISQNPGEADRFFAYHPINQGRILNHAKDLGQANLLRLSAEEIKEIEASYATAKPDFEEMLCETCGTKRLRISWSKLDLASMARKTAQGLRDRYVTLYLYPTLHAHATVPSVVSRITLTSTGQFKYKWEAQPENVGVALIGAHDLVLRVFDIMDGHFSLGLKEELQDLVLDFKEAWPEPPI